MVFLKGLMQRVEGTAKRYQRDAEALEEFQEVAFEARKKYGGKERAKQAGLWNMLTQLPDVFAPYKLYDTISIEKVELGIEERRGKLYARSALLFDRVWMHSVETLLLGRANNDALQGTAPAYWHEMGGSLEIPLRRPLPMSSDEVENEEGGLGSAGTEVHLPFMDRILEYRAFLMHEDGKKGKHRKETELDSAAADWHVKVHGHIILKHRPKWKRTCSDRTVRNHRTGRPR